MKRIPRISAIAGAMVAAVALVGLAPTSHSDAQAGPIVDFLSGGYYGGYGPVYGGYSGYGYSPYGYGYTYTAPRVYVSPPVRGYVYPGYGAGPYGYGSPGGYVYRPYGYRAYNPYGGPVYGPYSNPGYGRHYGVYGPYAY